MSDEDKISTKKSSDKNTILVDRFDKIRDTIRRIYLYSSYDNENDFEFSERTVRKVKHRVREMFKNNCKDNYEKNKKYVGLFYDAVIHSRNFLSDVYFIKSFTDFDITLYFLILGCLNEKDMSLNEILGVFEDVLDEYKNIGSKEDKDTQRNTTLDRHIKKLLKEGLIYREKQGRKYIYKIKEDFWQDFSKSEKEMILDLVTFYSEITPYKVLGHYLQETIKTELLDYTELIDYDDENKYRDWYYFSGNQIHNILEEIILYEIEKNKFIEVKIKKQNKKIKVCFLYRITDPVYGREFILTRAIDDNNLITDEYVIFRVDNIESVKKLKHIPKNLDEIDFNKKLKMWNCSIQKDNTKSLNLERVEAIFYIDEENDKALYERLLREKKWATLQKKDKGKYLFTIDVLNKKELIPWFRTFEGHVIVLDDYINNQFQEERKELLKRYGIF